MRQRFGPLRPGAFRLEGSTYLAKWLVIATIIGIVSGLGSVLFYFLLDESTKLLLAGLAGHVAPMAVGEGGDGIQANFARSWWLPLVVAGGALVSGVLVERLAPEAKGSGTDAAIEAVHRRAGAVRRRVPLVKTVASVILIGSGGSGGREGPAAHISAGIASAIADWLRLSAQDRRIAVSAGIGAGIGAIFRAPLGGALLAAELLYLEDLETEALMPNLIASIAGYSVFGAFYGFEPIFGALPHFALESPLQLPYYALLGLACGAVGILYAKTFYGLNDAFTKLRLATWLKPALGGLAVGTMALALPQVLHTGYGWVQLALVDALATHPLWLVLLLPFAKLLATSLSVGSGGSGGTFGPGMVIGGLVGAALWRLGAGSLPYLPADPAPFVIVGMMALFGSIAHAPLAMMLMVAEMTGNLSLLAPAMIAVALATALVGKHTIFRAQLRDRSAAPAHRVRMAFPLLSSLRVSDAMRVATTVQLAATVAEADPAAMEDGAVVIDSDDPSGVVVGVVTAEALAGAAAGTAIDVLITRSGSLTPDVPLDEALQALDAAGVGWMPVVDSDDSRRLLGRVGMRSIVATYKETLGRGVRRVSALPPETSLLEVDVADRSPLVGLSLAEARLPPATLVLALLRSGTVVYPRGDTVILAGDRLTLLTSTGHEVEVRSYLGG